jgi:hypothetical protein
LIQPVSYEQKKSDNNIYLGYAEAFPIKKNFKKKNHKKFSKKKCKLGRETHDFETNVIIFVEKTLQARKQ